MAVPQYKITFDGQLLPGIDKPTAVRNLATLFEASEDAVERLFDGRKLALKRHLLLEDTHKFVPMLEKAGIQTRLEDDTPFDPSDAETLAGGATYDDVAYSPWTTPKSNEEAYDPMVTGKHKILSLEGRLGRINYAAWSLLILIVGGFVVNAVAPMVEYLVGPSISLLIMSLCYLAASVVVGVRRLHDIDWSGWLILLSAIPYVGPVFALVMLFKPGTPGNNRFGTQPRPATLLAKLFVGIGCIFVVIAIGVVVLYFGAIGASAHRPSP
jgi:uncharacterized membrane protein YhaH (DUF805 family)